MLENKFRAMTSSELIDVVQCLEPGTWLFTYVSATIAYREKRHTEICAATGRD